MVLPRRWSVKRVAQELRLRGLELGKDCLTGVNGEVLLLLKGRFIDLEDLGIHDLETKSKIIEIVNSLAHIDPVGRLRLGLERPVPGVANADNSAISAHECARALEAVMWDDAEPCLLPMEVLALWTNNFSQDKEIGSGAFGSVFEAIVPKIPGGRSVGPVAVKKLSDEITLQQGQKQLRSEIKVLRQVNFVSSLLDSKARSKAFANKNSIMSFETCILSTLVGGKFSVVPIVML